MSETNLLLERCDAHWDDAEHLALRAEYSLQTFARIKNGAAALKMCARCVTEWRTNDVDHPFIAWVRSL